MFGAKAREISRLKRLVDSKNERIDQLFTERTHLRNRYEIVKSDYQRVLFMKNSQTTVLKNKEVLSKNLEDALYRANVLESLLKQLNFEVKLPVRK